MTEALLELERVDVAYSGHPVLVEVSLAVGPGEVVTLVGPNGAGKTTALKVALGLVRPDRGRVQRAAGLCVGYVPQHLVLPPTLPLTARRFLELAAPGGTAARLAAALDMVGASHALDRQVRDLSGGELRRVLVARAVLRRPGLLVLDEPVSGVDVAGQAELYDRIAAIRRETGCGVLMVSHDLHLVMAATDQVVCLNRHVCCAGSPRAVSRDPAYIGLFGDRVARSLAVYSHHHDHHHDAGGNVDAEGEDAPPPAHKDCRHG